MAASKRRKRRPASARHVPTAENNLAANATAESGKAGTRAASGPEASVEMPAPRRRIGTDSLVASGVAVGAAAVFASTFSSHVGLGDAPEYVSGVRSLGVVHAPGYPSYILVTRGFTAIPGFGSLAFRVNLFSLVCAALTIAGVFLAARAFGASRAGAVIGAFSLACATSFWFYADFAKHYAFSGLLVTMALVLVLRWQRTGRPLLLVGAAVGIGLGMGAATELTVIMAIGLVVLIMTGPRRPTAVWAAAAALIVVALTVAGWIFILWRARQHPSVNWGEATNAHGLLNLLSHRDFRSAGANAPSSWGALSRLPTRARGYLGIIVRDLGLGVCVLAVIGAVMGFREWTRDRKWFVGVVVALNLVAVLTVSVVDDISGFLTGMVAGGYLIDVLVVLAVLVGVGAGTVIDAAVTWIRRSVVRRARGALSPDVRIPWAFPVAVSAVVLLTIVPSLVVHYQHANHRIPDFADAYAHRVLRGLPRHSVLVSYQADAAFPYEYRQIVEHERPDVTVINADSVGLDWYRKKLTRELAIPPTTFGSRPVLAQVVRTLQTVGKSRPVVLDTGAMALLAGKVGYEANGLVGEMRSGAVGPRAGSKLGQRAADLRTADRAVGVDGHRYLRFPNDSVYFSHARAHVELAKQYLKAHNLDAVERELTRADDVFPDLRLQFVLQNVRERSDQSASLVRQL